MRNLLLLVSPCLFLIAGNAAISQGAGQPVNSDGLMFAPTATEACMGNEQEGGNLHMCIGASAEACIEESEGGGTTVEMSGCFALELQYWDDRLNAAYRTVRAAAKRLDAEMKEIGSSAPSQADALRDMQRAWIKFRDATCAYERSLWGGGTGAGPASVACMMNETAEQALFLEAQIGLN